MGKHPRNRRYGVANFTRSFAAANEVLADGRRSASLNQLDTRVRGVGIAPQLAEVAATAGPSTYHFEDGSKAARRASGCSRRCQARRNRRVRAPWCSWLPHGCSRFCSKSCSTSGRRKADPVKAYGQRTIGRKPSRPASRFHIARTKLGCMARRAACNTVVFSTVGTALRERGPRVGELQRRLADRGIHVSRGAVDRLASDRPLKAVNFELLVPVLEELGIALGEPLMAVPSEEHEPQRTARARAVKTARRMANAQTKAAESAQHGNDVRLTLHDDGRHMQQQRRSERARLSGRKQQAAEDGPTAPSRRPAKGKTADGRVRKTRLPKMRLTRKVRTIARSNSPARYACTSGPSPPAARTRRLLPASAQIGVQDSRTGRSRPAPRRRSAPG